MGISVGGIASGLDTDGIVKQLVGLEQRSILQIQRRIALAELKQQSYGDLDGRLSSLRSAARGLNDEALFRKVSATSSDEAAVTVSATKSASAGTYSMQVLQLAQRHQIAGPGFVDENTTGVAAANGVFRFKIGTGTEKTVNVTNTTTLRQLANAINAASPDVKAEIVNDGSATNPYRLVLTSKKDGLTGQINILQNDTAIDLTGKTIEAATADATNSADYLGSVTSAGAYTGSTNASFVVEVIEEGAAGIARYKFSADGGMTWNDNNGNGFASAPNVDIPLQDGVAVNFTDAGTLRVGDRFRIDVTSPTLQQAQDAILKVNGINVTKPSNTITDLATGVTINLKKAELGKTVSLKVEENVGDVETKLTSFVGAYNSVVGFLNAQFAYNPQEDKAGQGAPVLNGDSAARQVQTRLKSFVTGRVSTLSSKTISSLAELGVTSDEKTGLLTFDSFKLQEQLDKDPNAVQRVLTRYGEALPNAKFDYLRRSSASTPGEYDVYVTTPRSRAEVAGLAPAEALLAPETLTIRYNSDATNINSVPKEVNVALDVGDTPAAQLTKINQALSDATVSAEAFLDAQGALHVRTKEYGGRYQIEVSSTQPDGPGSTNFGNFPLADLGTDLQGSIGGKSARVLDGNHLKGAVGTASQDVEVIIPEDTSGALGRVRIVDGLGESLPDVVDSLGASTGLLKSRTDGLQSSIDDLNAKVLREQDRVTRFEERLRRTYSNLEVTMGRLNALGDYVSQQLGSMSSSRKK